LLSSPRGAGEDELDPVFLIWASAIILSSSSTSSDLSLARTSVVGFYKSLFLMSNNGSIRGGGGRKFSYGRDLGYGGVRDSGSLIPAESDEASLGLGGLRGIGHRLITIGEEKRKSRRRK